MGTTCTDRLEELESWVKLSDGFESYRIYVRGTRIKTHTGEGQNISNAVVSYFYGKLEYSEKNRVFYGDLKQLFNDRKQSDNQPFDLNKADILGIEIYADGSVHFTLKSWNNYFSTFIGKCEDGLMVGFDADHCFWVIDFAKTHVSL